MYKETKYVGDSNYKIIDTDFEADCPKRRWIAEVIIQVYEPRGLNVAANMALCFKHYCDKFGDWTMKNLINNTKKNVPEYAKYADDVEKYLMLV